jgi:hypothetical protein
MKRLLIAVAACAALGGCITTSTTATKEQRDDPAMAPITELINTKMGCRPRPESEIQKQNELARIETDEEKLRIATSGMGTAAHNDALTRYAKFRTACRDKGQA